MPPKAPKGGPAGKAGGKKMPAGIAKLKAMMEQKKEEEERLRKEEEERERQLREEERLAKEQAKLEEEEKRKEKERLKEEEKAKKKQKTLQTDVLERMRASDIIVPDVEKLRAETKSGGPIVYQKQKRAKAGAAAAAAAAAAASAFPTTGEKKDAKEEETESSDDEDDGEPEEEEFTEPSESDVEVDEGNWEEVCEQEDRREARRAKNAEIRQRREARQEEKRKRKEERKREKENTQGSTGTLRSPICCVLGHVDSGKTSLLDRIRSSNVQKGEAGGITQQIGATFFPAEGLLKAVGELSNEVEMKVPGLLVIDTPGHESFTNLRSRGSSICDIAVLVVDITHGLEQQTRESIRLLRENRCPFLVALNKVDRLYDWVPHENMTFQKTLAMQKKYVQQEFETRWTHVQQELMSEGLNSMLYYRNKELRKVVSIVPTSAHTGEGICDLLMLEIKLVQEYMKEKVTLHDELECTVLEVKPITGLGVTIDCILINGELHENDQICLCGQNGPIFTQIRFLLTPQPMKEMRVKGAYEHHHSIKAAMGIKICANDLEQVVPGTPLVVVHDPSERDDAERAVMSDATRLKEMVEDDGMGVTIQSSTLGALEALMVYLKSVKVPIGSFSMGTIQKRHLYPTVAMKRKNPRLGVVLAFDVDIADTARELAQAEGIKIIFAKVIYHLFDQFTAYLRDYDENELRRLRNEVIFPVQLKITGDAFHAVDPIVVPVKVERGQLREGTPLFVMRDSAPLHVGRVMSMEREHKAVSKVLPGEEVALKISTSGTNITFGRHIFESSTLYSQITRPSVNAIKKFPSELHEDDINLLATLIKTLNLPK